jgi:MFS family permease
VAEHADPPGARLPDVERARIAVAVTFALSGLSFASWISRIPSVRDALGLRPSELGLLLLCLSVGSVGGLPLSGPTVHRIGPPRAVQGGALVGSAGLALLAAGVSTESVPVAAVGLALAGYGLATWDVAMNVAGADVERRLGRTLMPRLHAAFSLGTVGGALLGAGCAAVDVSVTAQLLGTSAAVVVAAVAASRRFLSADPPPTGRDAPSSGALRAWREPRTLLVGVVVLAFGFTEGVANDWLTVAFVDGYGTSEAVGAVGFAVFVIAMTISRTVGGSLLERWGRVRVLQATAGTALAGLLLVSFGESPVVAGAGCVLWGVGAALGFPVGMSAAADDPERAAARVSVVASIGYVSFLAGPPLVGFLAEEFGVLRALLVVLAALLLGLLAARATAPAAAAHGVA